MNEIQSLVMTISMRISAAVVTLLLCGLPVASAQDTDEVVVEVGECIELEAPVERLACFAAQVEQALTESEATAASQDANEDQEPGADTNVAAAAAEAERAAAAAAAAAAEAERAAVAAEAERAAVAAAAEAERAAVAAAAEAERAAAAAAAEAERAAEAEARIAAAAEAQAEAAEAQAEAEDLNWFERRRARRAARAAEREAEERAEAAEAAANEIRATITALRERGPNSWLITLDNGQMWDQVRPQWYPLRPGQQVRLYPTNWGSSYRLSEVDRGGYIQVQRVR